MARLNANSRRMAIAFACSLVVMSVLGVAVSQSYYPVRPRLMCVMPLGTGATVAFFGYSNSLGDAFEEPVGDANYFEPGVPDRDQPTRFSPGSSGTYPAGSFSVPFEGEELVWNLGNREAVATRDSQRCPVPTTLAARDDKRFVLPKPKPPPPKPPEPPPKPVEKATEKVAEKPDPAKQATRKPKNYVRKKGQPKPRKRPPNKTVTTKIEQAPLVLADLVGLDKGVAIQAGEETILGDARVAATEENTNVEQVDDPKTVPLEVGDGTGGVRAPKRVAPRVKTRVRGVYPPDAPRLGRTVLVKLSLKVGADGRVKAVRVIKGAGAAFDREARAVGRKLVFTPGTVDGVPTEQWVPWLVEFTPDDW